MEYDDWVRSLVILVALFFSFFALQKTFSVPRKLNTTTTTDIKYSGKQLSLSS